MQLLTEAVANRIVEAVSQGIPVDTAARAAGVSHRAFYKLLERAQSGQEISESTRAWALKLIDKMDAARARWESERVKAVQAIALDAEHKDTYRANTWLLNNHPSTRSTYRPEHRSLVEHQCDKSVAAVHLTIRELPAASLLELADGLGSAGADDEQNVSDE